MNLSKSIAEIETAIADTARHQTRQAEVIALCDKIVAEHNGSLDKETCSRFAAAMAGVRLAEKYGPRLRARLDSLFRNGIPLCEKASAHVTDLHRELDGLIESALIARLPEDMREGVDVLASSKAFRAECATRFTGDYSSSDYSTRTQNDDSDLLALLGQLSAQAAFLKDCAGEVKRCADVRRKYEPAAA